MFTGIIETTAEVLERDDQLLIISRPKIFETLSEGQSIAVNGACLSVKAYDKQSIRFDVLSETFRCTNLGSTKQVNLERAMSANGRFEGHIVLGHVDETTKFLKKQKEHSGVRYRFAIPNRLEKYIVPKGSIAINGISLTLATVDKQEKYFEIAIIPLTEEHTNFRDLEEGDLVNMEADYIWKAVLGENCER
jgi:riboflavin synthase